MVSEAELHSLFSQYGNVLSAKIIMDRAGISKGYGFVTFQTEEEAQRIQKEADGIVLKDRKLDIAPAIKKQPYATALADPGQVISNSTILYPSPAPQNYNNAAVFSGGDSLYLSQVPYPSVIYPQHVFFPQQYYQASSGVPYPAQYVFTVPTASNIYAYGSTVPHHGAHPNEWVESSSSETSDEGGTNLASDCENSRMPTTKATKPSCNISSDNASIASSTFHPLSSQYLPDPMLAKSPSDGTVMAYPSYILMNPSPVSQVQDPGVQNHQYMAQLVFLVPL